MSFGTLLGQLVRARRLQLEMSQSQLAKTTGTTQVSISRLEGGNIESPHSSTIEKLSSALHLKRSELERLRSTPNQNTLASILAQASNLTDLPSLEIDVSSISSHLFDLNALKREELQNLAARFAIDDCFTLPDAELRRLLTQKAEEYRALKSEVDAIPDTMKRLSNLKAAAQDAIDRVDLEEVENLMAMVHEVELEEAAKSAEIRADTALLRGKVEDAYRYVCAAADSFAAVDPIAPALKRLDYFNTLYSHGLRYGSTGLVHAAQMIRDALDKLDKSAYPLPWSTGQNMLAVTLAAQARRVEGAEGTALLAQSVTAYHDVLEVLTRKDHAMSWAATQNNLANALQDQANRSEGAEGAALLAQSVTAYRNALEVYTRKDHPKDWAMTQNNLGVSLRKQSTRIEGKEGAALLTQSVTAYRSALEVRTRKDNPEDWAATQINLGSALHTQALRSKGTEGAELLTQAVTAYRNALEVLTRTDHPVQWAMTQENLAIVQTGIAIHDTCLDPRPPLIAALEAVDLALTVFDPVHMSFNHAKAIRVRNIIQAKLDALPPV